MRLWPSTRRLAPGFSSGLTSRPSGSSCGLATSITNRNDPSGCPTEKRLLAQRIDLIVESCVLVEIKVVARLDPVFVSQVVSYLRATQLRVGLLMNFSSLYLKDGLRRIVL